MASACKFRLNVIICVQSLHMHMGLSMAKVLVTSTAFKYGSWPGRWV